MVEPPPVTLGWKWVPGESLQIEHKARATQGQRTVTRVEVWDYLVRDVDPEGVATLEGKLTGLGAQVLEGDDQLTDRETRRAREYELGLVRPVVLRIAMDGRLAGIEGADWGGALTHRLLAEQLSRTPVVPGDSWPDPAVARPYADPVPVDLELTVEGFHTLEGLYDVDGTLLARVETRGAVRPDDPGAPQIWLNGESWWDPARGRMTSRELRVVLANDDGPGELTLSVRELR